VLMTYRMPPAMIPGSTAFLRSSGFIPPRRSLAIAHTAHRHLITTEHTKQAT
jgi:hypothetical protein